MERSFRIILVLSVLLATLLPSALAWMKGNSPPDPEQLEKLEQRNDERRAEKNTSMAFYGQVVDLDGNPVEGARVKMHKTYVPYSVMMSDHQPVEAVTDSSGRFTVEETGFSLYLDEIAREGYQYTFRYNKKRGFDFIKGEKPIGPGFEPDKPFTFRVRKLAPPAFVVIHNMTFGKKPGTSSMFDLIKRQWVHREADIIAMQYSSVDRDWHTDVKLSVEGEPGKMRLILEAPDPDSGFVVEKHEFFEQMTEAPEHGYRQKLDIPVESSESPVTAYVKCQGGLFYAKIDIGFSEDRPGVVGINATSFTNLAKGRGLEYIPSVESQYDREVYSDHTRQLVRRADLLSGQPIEMPKGKP